MESPPRCPWVPYQILLTICPIKDYSLSPVTITEKGIIIPLVTPSRKMVWRSSSHPGFLSHLQAPKPVNYPNHSSPLWHLIPPPSPEAWVQPFINFTQTIGSSLTCLPVSGLIPVWFSFSTAARVTFLKPKSDQRI